MLDSRVAAAPGAGMQQNAEKEPVNALAVLPGGAGGAALDRDRGYQPGDAEKPGHRESTVKSHVGNILGKLAPGGRTQAAVLRLGQVGLSESHKLTEPTVFVRAPLTLFRS